MHPPHTNKRHEISPKIPKRKRICQIQFIPIESNFIPLHNCVVFDWILFATGLEIFNSDDDDDREREER